MPTKIIKAITEICKPSTKVFKIILQHGEKSKSIQDFATFENPMQYATGINHVFVNGSHVLKNGDHTGVLAGKFVKGPGYQKNIFN